MSWRYNDDDGWGPSMNNPQAPTGKYAAICGLIAFVALIITTIILKLN